MKLSEQRDLAIYMAYFANAAGGSLSYPSALEDGNTVGWYEYGENITEATGVSVWGDKSANGNNLTQGTGGYQPTLEADGILFDGTDDFLRSGSLSLEQPTFIYAVLKQITWTANDRIFDGYTSTTGYFRQRTSTPNVQAAAGLASSLNGDLTLDTFSIVRVLFNGASSKLQIDDNTATSGDFGNLDMGGITLGAAGAGGSNHANIKVKALIIRSSADNATDETSIYNYLYNKYMTVPASGLNITTKAGVNITTKDGTEIITR